MMTPLLRAALKQALVWGTGSALAQYLTGKKKKMTKKEKEELKRALMIAGLTGALSGAIGAVV